MYGYCRRVSVQILLQPGVTETHTWARCVIGPGGPMSQGQTTAEK